MEDADGDTIRCRWAESILGECGGVCRAFPAVLDEVGCTVLFLQFVEYSLATEDIMYHGLLYLTNQIS